MSKEKKSFRPPPWMANAIVKIAGEAKESPEDKGATLTDITIKLLEQRLNELGFYSPLDIATGKAAHPKAGNREGETERYAQSVNE